MTGEPQNRAERRQRGHRSRAPARYNRPRRRTGTTAHFATWMHTSRTRLDEWRRERRKANAYKSIPCGGIDGERECKHTVSS